MFCCIGMVRINITYYPAASRMALIAVQKKNKFSDGNELSGQIVFGTVDEELEVLIT